MAGTSKKQDFLAQGNVYLPHIVRIEKIVEETPDTRTLHLCFEDEELRERFTFRPGQFGEYSVLGVGEAPFAICSSPTQRERMECTPRMVGKVTEAIHNLRVGDQMGFRGPYGNGFPMEELKGKSLVFIAGGIGLAALRSPILYALVNRGDYQKIDIVYGARSPQDLCYKYDLKSWEEDESVNMVTTVDRGDEEWKGRVGFVPQVLEEAAPSSENAVAFICGPPVMIRFTFPVLEKLGFTPDRIITTLEKRMKCGIGKCGRCNIGNIRVCTDGPVFTYAQIQNFISDEV
jgi:NAD(P)H-flavin reductase